MTNSSEWIAYVTRLSYQILAATDDDDTRVMLINFAAIETDPENHAKLWGSLIEAMAKGFDAVTKTHPQRKAIMRDVVARAAEELR